MNIKLILLVLTLTLIQNCTSSWPDWLLKAPHAISPDGKAAIYQSLKKVNNNYEISVSSLVKGGPIAGGAGVFDYYYASAVPAILNWESDSTIIIQYPEDAGIIRQENHVYFMGRSTTIIYRSIPPN